MPRLVLGDTGWERPVGGVFLNYRTGDGDWAAALVKRELSGRFGADNVFYAGQSIRLGQDFSREILGRLRQSEVLLALIGPRWLAATDRQGGRRLDNPEDWVRREISEAFHVGLRVIPVLLDGIDRLSEPDLPSEIAQLARCQYLRMHHRSDDFDLTRLIDELIELVPGLLATRPEPVPERVKAASSNGVEGELRSTITQLRQAMADPATVDDIVQTTLRKAVDTLAKRPRPNFDDDPSPTELADWLESAERDMAPLLRLVAVGVSSGDRQHDTLWLAVLKHLLTEAYPALLMTYAVGVGGLAAGREDLVYRLLKKTTTPARVPVIRALALRHVVDPRHAAALPKWRGTAPYQPLSVHLRETLRPLFFNVIGDNDYESAFEEYEYLRTMLELHDGAFSSLGEFAVQVDKGGTAVHQRMAPRLAANSVLLRSGAFDGDTARVSAAWAALRQSTYGRYS